MSFYHEKALFWRVYKADFEVRKGMNACVLLLEIGYYSTLPSTWNIGITTLPKKTIHCLVADGGNLKLLAGYFNHCSSCICSCAVVSYLEIIYTHIHLHIYIYTFTHTFTYN